MSRRRKLAAAAIALCGAALAAAGCGLGPGKGLGDVSLRITRDFGTRPVQQPGEEGVTEADTVMRVLEREADIETGYSGGFVESIDGLEEDEGNGEGPEDWFFYVNGVESGVGAAQYPLHGGESIWWDYHDWGAAIHIPAVVGSYPEPFLHGYEGEGHPVAVVCRDPRTEDCAEVLRGLERNGVSAAEDPEPPGDAIRVLVGPWGRLREDPAAGQIERGPQASGVYAEFAANGGGCRLRALDESGRPAATVPATSGLVAATRHYEDPPTWIVSGCGEEGVETAAFLFGGAEELLGHFAVIAEPQAGKSLSIPVRGG